MLTVAAAEAAIRDALAVVDAEAIPVDEAPGRVLRQRVTAERDQPPYDRVTMDGIALRHAAFAGGRREFRVAATLHAGDPPLALDADDACIEVMTGAVLPAGSDCVIPVERLERDGARVRVDAQAETAPGRFVHARASDHARGALLLEPGRRLTPIDIALLASAGLTRVEVSRRPSLWVVSTGNELVPAGRPIADHQVRMSNGPALVAMLNDSGLAAARHRHLPDEPAVLREEIGELLEASDALVLSGGVSMGQADFVPRVLDELGVERVFHRISQRPGKPMWFGRGPAGQLVFALPGNPVSALVCCRRYVLPALAGAAALPPGALPVATLETDYRFEPALTAFLPVATRVDGDGRLCARPLPTNTSGDFTALAATSGFLELPADLTEFAAGSAWPYFPWQAARP